MRLRAAATKGLVPLSLMLALASGAACGSAQTVMIHDGPEGAVYLEDLGKGSLDATQPTSLASPTLQRILAGIHVQQDTRMLQQLMPDKPEQIRAFSQREVESLAPLLQEALSQATPSQVVRFEAVRRLRSGRETTGGALYVKHGSVYITLTRYRARPGHSYSAIKSDRLVQDATGLQDRKVLFIPQGISRTDANAKPGLVGPAHLTTLVLDYHLLDKLAGLKPEPPRATRAAPPEESPDARAPSLEERVTQQEREIEALKEELRSLQHDGAGPAPAGQQPAP